MSNVYLSLGSNLGNRQHNLQCALAELAALGSLRASSSLYETEPVGPADQPPFLNLVVELDTRLSPLDLLHRIKGVEQIVGRTPTYRWGPRVIDLDILFFDDEVIESEELTVPHAELDRRAFVLVPLAEIAPDVIHPLLQVSVSRLRDVVAGRETVRRYT
ncbi:MAG: 2-amino-4-hydroxy-6-hydroxymethyldihydropteridine diphosphokinase [Chloroflexota bacterium]